MDSSAIEIQTPAGWKEHGSSGQNRPIESAGRSGSKGLRQTGDPLSAAWRIGLRPASLSAPEKFAAVSFFHAERIQKDPLAHHNCRIPNAQLL